MKETKRLDARVIRTKRDLRSSLLSLLKEEPFEKITVKMICDHASINKMTFYAHYQDKYDLLDDLVRSMGEGVRNNAIGEMPIENEEDVARAFGKLGVSVLEKCAAHKEEIFSVRRSGNSLGLAVFESAIEDIVKRLIDKLSEKKALKYSANHISAFLMGGFQKLILTILEEPEFDATDLEESFTQVVLALLKGKVIVE
ncbi:MAG: TetR/AcrR family transcriptional regulator [Bacilli bacterium]|nr:TetR/AcrR family transcriptional regulator [Bacilli bacterium]